MAPNAHSEVLNAPRNANRLMFAVLFLVAEATLLIIVYRMDLFGALGTRGPQTTCLDIIGSHFVCDNLGQVPPTIILITVVLAIASKLGVFKEVEAAVIHHFATTTPSKFWLGLNLTGLLLLVAPYFLGVVSQDHPAIAQAGPLLWLFGSIAFVAGLAPWIVPLKEISGLFNWKSAALVIVLFTAPQLSGSFGRLARFEAYLQNATFELSYWILRLLGEDPFRNKDNRLGIDNFEVSIAASCSGVSGIAFSAALTAGFLFLMRSRLITTRAIVLVPLVVVLSWLLNSVRIAGLMLIGAYVSRDLAVDGFHSFAGWISLAILTGFMAVLADRLPWFQSEPVSHPVVKARSVLRDPVAAQILPFLVFIFSSLLIGAMYASPSYGYPVRILVTIAALVVFWRCLPEDLSFEIAPVSFVAGIVIAIIWLFGQSGEATPLAEMVPKLTGVGLMAWVVLRLFGTAVIIPIVEELFFRGYLLKRLDIGGTYGPVIALAVSSALFAALHGDLVLALIAGLMLGGLVLWTGRLLNAIIAHAIANAVIGLWALMTNDWSVI